MVGSSAPPEPRPVRTVPILVADMDTLVEARPNVFADVFRHYEGGRERQIGKIRRGEDWRRSSHDATIRAWDVPTPTSAMAGRMAAKDLHVFGHDLWNAYRQWPVKQPSHNATFLGLTLWFYVALCFGATASVWNFNKVADQDAPPHGRGPLCRARPQRLPRLLRWASGLRSPRRNPDRPAPPAKVDVHLGSSGVRLRLTPRRVQKLRHAIGLALQHNSLTPREAGRLAGQLSFLTQAVFGAVGRSAPNPCTHGRMTRAWQTTRGSQFLLCRFGVPSL